MQQLQKNGKNLNNNIMSWYGNYNQSTKQLDFLLDTKPNLATLLIYPDFIQQLRAFNPKLLQYITNSNTIPHEIVTYLSVAPSQTDPTDRKYRFPLLTIQMVQTQTICIMNALLKQNSQNITYFLTMFQMLQKKQVLPLLTGYFNRATYALSRTKYKQILESVYSSTRYLQLLINNSENQSIASCLCLFLCIESSKNIVLSEQKLAIKMGIIRSILNKIQIQRNLQSKRCNLIQNLCFVIREIIQKYYLIDNGKQMLEIILEEKHVQMIMAMIADQNDSSFPAMGLALSYLKYYSLSAFNSQQGTQQLARKNIQRLQSQSFVKIIHANFHNLLQKIKRQKSLSLYGYSLLEVLCHCITLSSTNILNIIKQTQLFPALIDLLFKNQNNNILHKLVERAYLHIFTTEKNIYQKYKQYLFCQISVIDLTAKRLLQLFPENDCLEKAKNKGYFGILMKIIKIYSSISTTNVQIREAITSKSDMWNKITKRIIKPYEASCKQQIGQLENVPQSSPIQFVVKKIQNQFMPRLVQNSEVVQQIKRQEEKMPKTFQLNNELKKQNQTQTFSQAKPMDETFFKSPLQDSLGKKKSNEQTNNSSSNFAQMNNDVKKFQQSTKLAVPIESDKNTIVSGRISNYSDFINKRKAQVGEEIKRQRSESGQKRLSADKGMRLASPHAGRKKNSWKQQSQDEKRQKQKQKIQIKIPTIVKDLPKIPIAQPHKTMSSLPVVKNLAKSTVEEVKKPSEQDQNKRMLSLSMANLQTLKKTTIIRITQQPTQRKYRKARSKDKALFAYLGINS